MSRLPVVLLLLLLPLATYSLRYQPTIKGRISVDLLTNLQGVSVKVLFFWLNIIEVTRNGDDLSFSVGIASADFGLDNFLESPTCGCGFDCNSLELQQQQPAESSLRLRGSVPDGAQMPARRRPRRSVAGIDQDDLLDPDSSFYEINGVRVHHKLCANDDEEDSGDRASDPAVASAGKNHIGLPIVLLHGFGASEGTRGASTRDGADTGTGTSSSGGSGGRSRSPRPSAPRQPSRPRPSPPPRSPLPPPRPPSRTGSRSYFGWGRPSPPSPTPPPMVGSPRERAKELPLL